tara:strand:- start:389 stop:1309 length:921 start_codon:yes stop_codon:yes gene_type:complete
MSEIVNTNIGEAGTPTSGSEMDSKFDDARTASLNLDDKNVRSEGIDRRQLETYSYPNGRLEPVVYMDRAINNDTSDVTYASKDGLTPFMLNAGTDDLLLDWTGFGGVVMQQGDLLRINYNIVLMSHNLGHTNLTRAYWPPIDLAFGTGPFGSGHYNALGLCAMVYPVWDTSTTSGWQPLPGRAANLNTTFGSAPSTISINDEGSTDGCLFLSLEGIISGGTTLCNRSGMVSAYYRHTSATPMTIYQIRLNGRMPVTLHSSSGTNKEILIGDWTTLDYIGSHSYAANFTFKLERGSIGAVVMRGDSL